MFFVYLTDFVISDCRKKYEVLWGKLFAHLTRKFT